MADSDSATPPDVTNERDWASTHNHMIGLRNQYGRFPGLTHPGDDWRYEIEKEAEAKWDELVEMVAEGNLVTVRDFMTKQEDIRLRRPEVHPRSWRYVLHTTEDYIKKQQPWFINQKAKEKDQQQQQQQPPPPPPPPPQQQKPQPQPQQDQEKQQEGVSEDTSQQEPGNKYTPDQQAYLQSLKQEQEYMRNLAVNDGQGESPIKGPTYPDDLDEVDQYTPDNWVARSDGLIRLTGKHPFNGEANLTKIYEAGLITPNRLHYVRNHGAVPHLLWESHKIEVSAGTSLTLTMDDLTDQFPSINIPVFLACDGNRRKELNMIRRSKGFDFGAGAVGCAYWKGALLRDILTTADVWQLMQEIQQKRLWVNFEGVDELREGKYATSLSLDHAMNPCNDVMIAYAMNNLPLPADHGYPVRLIIPGFIGGRCIKWLSKIWITDYENDSYHHIYDNRFLPAFVTNKGCGFAEILYRHPSTIINEQALNSVIVRPAQGEQMSLEDVKKGRNYRIQGFAYAGGGDEIQAVEVSLDDGLNWLYCTRQYPDAPLRHDRKFWTWLHWHVDIDISHLLQVDNIIVRCFDVKKNSQPKEPTWNLEGMMNNCWYVVKPEVVGDSEGDKPCLTFRHPCEPGTGQGGWKQPSVENQMQDIRQQASAPSRQFARDEIEKHSTERDTWIVVNGKVYDVTSVLAWHPGGKQAILPHAGRVHIETTDEYEGIHDAYARGKLEECAVGVVTKNTMEYMMRRAEEKAKKMAETAVSAPEAALKAHKWTRVKLVKKSSVSEDTHRYTFSLPPTTRKLGMETGQYINVGFHFQDQLVFRPYTPTRPLTEDEEDGTFDLTVKTYYPDPSQPGGTMSNILDCLLHGEEVEVKGPLGEIRYRGSGHFKVDQRQFSFDRITLILGGSGITPGYQLIARILKVNEDKTKIKIIDANKTENDILMKEELAQLEKDHPEQLQICHVLSHAGEDWRGEKGRVDKRIIQQYSFPPDGKSLALLCGPPAMIKTSVLPALQEWGYHEDINLLGF